MGGCTLVKVSETRSDAFFVEPCRSVLLEPQPHSFLLLIFGTFLFAVALQITTPEPLPGHFAIAAAALRRAADLSLELGDASNFVLALNVLGWQEYVSGSFRQAVITAKRLEAHGREVGWGVWVLY